MDVFTFRRLLRQETERPARLSLRCVGAGESDDLGLIFLMECYRSPHAGSVVESTVNAVECAACTHINHRPMGCAGVQCDLRIDHTLIGLEKDESTTNDASGV